MILEGQLDMDALKAEIIRDEGIRLRPYRDSVGVLTIGIGHNLSRGLTRAQVDAIFEDDVSEVVSGLMHGLPWWEAVPGDVKRVLVNMGFVFGVEGLLREWRPTLDHISTGDYREAAKHLRASLWARQAPNRVERLALALENR